MLVHCKQMLGHINSAVTIHPRFIKLITPLRTAVETGKDLLDKDATSYDAFRLIYAFLALKNMKTKRQKKIVVSGYVY